MYLYIYIYIDRERDRERERCTYVCIYVCIVPERPRESSRLPIKLALSGTRSCTGCALPPPPPSLPLRPFVGPNERGSEVNMYV